MDSNPDLSSSLRSLGGNILCRQEQRERENSVDCVGRLKKKIQPVSGSLYLCRRYSAGFCRFSNRILHSLTVWWLPSKDCKHVSGTVSVQPRSVYLLITVHSLLDEGRHSPGSAFGTHLMVVHAPRVVRELKLLCTLWVMDEP